MRKGLLLLTLSLLWLGFCFGEEAADTVSFQTLTVQKDATYVDLGTIKVKDYDALCAFLDQLPNLQQLDMYATEIRKKNIDLLAQRYPQVEFGWTMVISSRSDKHLIRTDATAFSTLHNNQSDHHTSADFSILKYCKNLLALDVGHNSVDDLSFLYDLPKLKVLIIACNIVEDITPIACLQDLEYLEIFKNKITDLTPLTGLQHLIDLNICFNRIQDWTPIHSLTNLQRLMMYNSNNYSDDKPVPTSVVEAIREALPSCDVDAVSYSTLGTWRTHERYFVINEMFKTGVYIPFASAEETE